MDANTTTDAAVRRSSVRRSALVVAGLTALWFVVLVASVPAGSQPPESNQTVYAHVESRAEYLITLMDGKAFAQIATDPLFARGAEAYGGDPEQGAYQAMRPLQGWVDWAASLGGQRPLLAPMMLVLGVLFIGLLPLAVDAVARAHGRTSIRGELVLLAPATIAFFQAPGLCEPLAACLGLWGLARWQRGERGAALVLLSLAALTRETSLLLPLGLALSIIAGTKRLRPALPLLVPAVVYAAWGLVVRARLGAFPVGSDTVGAPFAGLRVAIPHWHGAEWLTAIGLVVCAVAVWRSAIPTFRWILGVHLLFVTVLGPVVLLWWWAWGRVLLPIFLLAMVQRARATPQADPAVGATALAEHG